MTYQSLAPTSPPISAAKTSSYARSTLRPSSPSRLATSQPATMKAKPRHSPKVWMSRPKTWISGSTPPRLAASEVVQRVHDGAVDPRLEMQVRPEAAARAADVADHLPLADARADGGAEARL